MISNFLQGLNPVTPAAEIVPHNLQEQNRLSILIDALIATTVGNAEMTRTVNNMLRHFLWNATAYGNDGRNSTYRNQHYWTESAIRLYLTRKADNYANRESGLRHEHSVPINLIKEKIWEDPQGIQQLINSLCIAVVVTKHEDDVLNTRFRTQMPDGFNWDEPNVFMRYHEADIGPIYNISQEPLLQQLITANRAEFQQLVQNFV